MRLFCETYNPEAVYWPWSPDHLTVLEAIEQSVIHDACLAIAMPRGAGKTTICRMAIMWAVANALVPYAFLIGANEDKAVENLDAVKLWMRALPLFSADYPEISIPVEALGGIANRASGQLCYGEPTYIRWERDRLVLPRVRKPANMSWHRGKYAPTSGAVIGVSGLTGEGIRGSLFARPDGTQIRPSLVLLDDPQTDESAASPTQNATRERLIRGAVLGMAGPGERMSAVMPCTVIREGDMADRMLDRKRNPLWRGVRTRLLRSMPTNTEAWQHYWDVYRECMGQTTPDIGPANAHYQEHREILDAGAEAAWEARKTRDELSAVQHAMNLLCERGEEAFWAEYQNQPKNMEAGAAEQLKAEQVRQRINHVPRGVLPKTATHLTVYVDVHQEIFYWLAAAWGPEFTGDVVDYGTYPEQPVRYFAQSDPPKPLAVMHAAASKQAVIQAALRVLVDRLTAREFCNESGARYQAAKILVDSKWETEAVKAYCRRSGHGETVMPAMGFYLRPGNDWNQYFKKKGGGQTGYHWRIPPPEDGQRYVLIDTDAWKTHAADRLKLAVGDPGAWSLFGDDPRAHDLLADHLCSEVREWRQLGDQGKWHWEQRPGRPDNHWWDCLVGSAVAASVAGLVMPGMDRPARKRVKLSDLQAAHVT